MKLSRFLRRIFVATSPFSVALLLLGCSGGSPDPGSSGDGDGTLGSGGFPGGSIGGSGAGGGSSGLGGTGGGSIGAGGIGAGGTGGEPTFRYTTLVDPLIGTAGPSKSINCFPGAILPWGMVSPSPETRPVGDLGPSGNHAAGYLSEDKLILGFTHTRLQGTSTPDQGSVHVMPTEGPPEVARGPDNYQSEYLKGSEYAEPGYYSVTLTDAKVKVELTATERGAHHRYTYGATPEDGIAQVVLDLGQAMHTVGVKDGNLIVDGAVIEGSTVPNGRFSGPSNGGLRTHFSLKFEPAPISVVTWKDGDLGGQKTRLGSGIGAVASFPAAAGDTIELRVGISYVDAKGARQNRESELGRASFETIRARASEAWQEQLAAVQFEGGSEDERVIMATAVYHSFVVPTMVTDVDGRYRGFDGQVHEADWLYHTNFSMWDTYRTVHPLLSLVRRDRQSALSRSLIQMAREGGYFPRWAMGQGYPNITAGSPANIVVGESYLRGVSGFDPEEALDLMLKEIDNPPPGGHPHSGREGLEHYLAEGYVPLETETPGVGKRVVVRTLEYAIADEAIFALARAVGRTDDEARANVWRKNYATLWDPTTNVFRGRHANGDWVSPFNSFSGSEELYYGANATQYSWLVPHDMAGLISLHGSTEAFLNRLTVFFEQAKNAFENGTPNSHYTHTNEPDIHAMYLFSAAGRPDLTQKWVDWVQSTFYSAERDGIAGNEDAGTLSAWYVLSAIGLYPVTSTDIWVLGRPKFPRMKLAVEGGTLEILAPGADQGKIYIAGVHLNGTPLAHPWLHHVELAQGGTLEFTMSDVPTTWGQDFGTFD